MREIALNDAEWNSKENLCTSFFRAVGAPSWHGRNFDALVDSIETGQINAIEAPDRIGIQNYTRIGPDARQMAIDFVDLLHEIAVPGCPKKP